MEIENQIFFSGPLGRFIIANRRGRQPAQKAVCWPWRFGMRGCTKAREHEPHQGEPTMQLGMIGLGRMGGNMVERLMSRGHSCVVYDRSADAVKALTAKGATGAGDLKDFVKKLTRPRAAWIMVPAGGPTESTVNELAAMMEPSDILIDGGNSYFKDDARRAKAL
jgi:lactate dehydrogenase-like 2-hydroxyacid dehydrogenase